MATGWTPERRKQQAELIATWKPWKRSTGPKTAQGKANSSRNAFKDGFKQQIKELRQILKQQNDSLKNP